MFPGRPHYSGPTTGVFGLLHHDALAETSHDVTERVAYVQRHKPPHEVATRLHNMIFLGGCPAAAEYAALADEWRAKRAALDAEYWAKRALALDAALDEYWAKRAALDAEYVAKRAALDALILAYIRLHIPDCAWNGRELVFNNG